MAKANVDNELKRCRALLSEKRVRAPVVEGKPEREPKSLGAKGGIGFTAEPGVTASVYVFDDWSRHQDAATKLKAEFGGEGVHVLHGSNGPLFFFGHTRIDGAEGRAAKFRLSDMLSAFSGNE